jgi:hypothetical protein
VRFLQLLLPLLLLLLLLQVLCALEVFKLLAVATAARYSCLLLCCYLAMLSCHYDANVAACRQAAAILQRQ